MIPQSAQYPVGASRQVWDNLIHRYGEVGILRQPGFPDRTITVCFGQYSVTERIGGVSNPADKKALVSVISPDTGEEIDPAPSEKDVLVSADGQLFKIVAPPARIGTTSQPLYWRLSVRR